MNIYIVIPIRYIGTRFNGRPLADDTGWPLIRHVYEQAKKSKIASRVIVATDDQRVVNAVEGFGGIAKLTGSHHRNGSERINEVAAEFKPDDLLVNLQGDEPEMMPENIDSLIKLHLNIGAQVTTAAVPFDDRGPKEGHLSPLDTNSVKVITNTPVLEKESGLFWGNGIYFSRNLIPYPFYDKGMVVKPEDYLLHNGIYIYSVKTLSEISQLPLGKLERIEKLEQLRFIENNYKIAVGIQNHFPIKVNTNEDYLEFVKRWQKNN